MTDESGPETDLADATIRGMLVTLRPEWELKSIDREAKGTDFVARLEVRTPAGERTVVLKAATAAFLAPEIARAEPRLLERVGRETSIPVPAVLGYRDDHEEYPAPFFLLDYVAGENFEGRVDDLPDDARERICRDAGRHLAALHDLGPLSVAGQLGVRDGDLAVLEGEDYRRFDDPREWALAHCEGTLDALSEGGYFPDLADDPERFADLVPDLRTHVREAIPALPAPDPPTYCHGDYRYGNLLVDSATGATNAVIDWGNLSATEPAYNLANAESLLLDPDRDPDERTSTLREAFRSGYAGAREGWTFDAATRGRMHTYRLVCRLDDMACLPLWHDPGDRDERAREHRQFGARYL